MKRFTSGSLRRYFSSQQTRKPFKISQTPNVEFAPRIDYRFLVENEAEVSRMVADRKVQASVPRTIELYKEKVSIAKELDNLRHTRKQLTKTKGKPSSEDLEQLQTLKTSIQNLEVKLRDTESLLWDESMKLPNTTHPDSPIGPESEAIIVGESDEWKDRVPNGRSHLEVGEELEMFDFQSAARTTGSKFVTLTNDAALLELALVQWTLNKLQINGYIPMLTPDIAQSHVVRGCGFNPRGESSQIYRIANSQDETEPGSSALESIPNQNELCLIGTSEIMLAGAQAGSLFDESALPYRVAGFSHCFRMEAGTRGSASKGLYRLHQFSKVEMFSFSTPEQSEEELLTMRDMQEEICDQLGLKWRTLEMPTEELGASAHRKFDVEVYMPSRNGFGEVASISNCTDYQSRRLNIRYKANASNGEKSSNHFVHTLNGTGCAVPRLILAILETHQQDNGRVSIPTVLRPYFGGRDTLSRPGNISWRV